MQRSGVLVIGMSAVGDFIRCLTAVQLIAARHPGEPIDVLASEPGCAAGVYAPDVRNVYIYNRKHGILDIAGRRRVAREIRKANHSIAYVLTTSYKAALIPWFAGVPKRVGWFGEARYPAINRPRFKFHVHTMPLLEDHAMLLLKDRPIDYAALPAPRLAVPLAEIAACRAKLGIQPGQRVVATVPGSLTDRRTWAHEKTLAFSRRCLDRGWAVWLIGAGRDRQVMELLSAAEPRLATLLDAPLEEAIVRLASADAFVGPDTGLTHLTAALGVPVVALYSAYSKEHFGPINKAVRFIVDETVDYHKAEGSSSLTSAISVDAVFTEVAQILTAPPASLSQKPA